MVDVVEHRAKGITLRFIAASAFAVMSAATKASADLGVSTYEIVFYRNILSLPVVLIWLAVGPGFRSVRTRRYRAHAMRAVVGLTAMALCFQAIVLLPLSESTSIIFTAPLFSVLLSAVMLSEKVGAQRWAAVAVGLAGVVIMTQPGSGAISFTGLAFGIGGAVFAALATVTLRQIGATEPAATTVFWFTIAASLLLAPGMLIWGHAHAAAVWPMLILMGLTGGVGQIMMTASLRFAPVSVVVPFDYVQLMWAVLITWYFWSDPPTAAVLIGAALIAGGGIYTAWSERRSMRRA